MKSIEEKTEILALVVNGFSKIAPSQYPNMVMIPKKVYQSISKSLEEITKEDGKEFMAMKYLFHMRFCLGNGCHITKAESETFNVIMELMAQDIKITIKNTNAFNSFFDDKRE